MHIGKYILMRLVVMVLIMIAIATIMFAMFQIMPGDPLAIFVDEALSEDTIAKQKALWGLDDPLHVRYLRYLKNLFTFDFGTSFMAAESVRPIIMEKLANTTVMMMPAIILMTIFGALIGAVIGWKRGSLMERSTLVVALNMRSIPSFFFGILLLMIFAYWLELLPASGMMSPGIKIHVWEMFFRADFWHHLILPVMAIFFRQVCDPLLVMRSTMIEIKGEDFLDILRAKGLTDSRIIWHASRNALLPYVTYLAVLFGFLFHGQVLLETVFAWPGIGREIVQSMLDSDYPVMQAAFFLSALIAVSLNFIADVLYGFLDPRVSYQ